MKSKPVDSAVKRNVRKPVKAEHSSYVLAGSRHFRKMKTRGWSQKGLALSAGFLVGLMGCKVSITKHQVGVEASDFELLPGVTAHTISHDGIQREYLVYLPESYDQNTQVPLMLHFHGAEMNADHQLEIADFRELADRENFIVVYPQGTMYPGEGPHWNTMFGMAVNTSQTDDLGFVDMLIDNLTATYSIDTKRVYATGFSNGAGFTYSLACHLSEKIAAIAPVSGLMLVDINDRCNPAHPTPLLKVHGTLDQGRPYDGYQDLFSSVDQAIGYWTSFNQTNPSPTVNHYSGDEFEVEHYTYGDGENSTAVELYKLVGGEHEWFELDIQGADLNQVIWEFFSQYDTDGLRQ